MRYLIIMFFLGIISANGFAQGIEFFHGTWEEALEEARKSEKLLFVDAYAVWCGPCKRMAKNVFTKKEVGDFFNANFVNLKLDMEKGEGVKFRQKFPVSAYPTLFFIDLNEKALKTVVGGQQAEQLISLGKSVLEGVDYSVDYAKAYEEGNRDPEFIFDYIKALNKSGKSSLKVANEYLKEQKDLSTPENLRIILEATTEADSRIFDMLIEYRKDIEGIESRAAVNAYIEKACRATAAKALEFEVYELQEEAKEKMKKHYPQRAQQFALIVDMEYCIGVQDTEGYLKACNEYVKKIVKKDANKLHEIALEIEGNFSASEKAMKHAEKIAKSAAENGGLHQYYLTYAGILLKNGKKKDALEAANKSLSLAQEQKQSTRPAEHLIQIIENS